MKPIVIIGAGAAGMMAAVFAAEMGAAVVVLERNPYAGRKLRITGKGRCNVTSNSTPNEVLEAVVTNRKFLYGAVNRFTSADTMAFFENSGVPLKTERGRRVFPQSDKAADIQEAFLHRMRDAGVEVRYNARVKALTQLTEGWRVTYEGGEIEASSVIMATGGVSYPGTGSTGDGHRILRGMGVKITPLKPSLVPIVTEEDFSPLSGLTLKNVTLNVYHRGRQVFTEMGELLFTHFGVSGPLVLSASANMQAHPVGEYEMKINLKPALAEDELDRRLVSDFAKYSARDYINALTDLSPSKLIPFLVEQSSVDPHKKTAQLSREDRAALRETLRGFKLTPKSFRPINEAIITSGGVDVSELSPKTMELKQFRGLYAVGELIDVDAYTGGYNLQIAFSTAYVASQACVENYFAQFEE